MAKSIKLEEIVIELEAIVERMESGEVSVEARVQLFEKAEKLSEKALEILEVHKGAVTAIADKISFLEEKFDE